MDTRATITSDTTLLMFSVEAKPVVYGDKRTFYKFRVLMRHRGRVVGVRDGPGRTHKSRTDARRAGYAIIRTLKRHRLFIIRVREADIRHGEAHSCRDCAIARALYRNLERMGFSEWTHHVEVIPYGGDSRGEGVGIIEQSWPYAKLTTGDEMPDLVTIGRKRISTESMHEWAMSWDDWADSRQMSLADWRERHGYRDDERPWKPSPCWFVLDLTAMKLEAAK